MRLFKIIIIFDENNISLLSSKKYSWNLISRYIEGIIVLSKYDSCLCNNNMSLFQKEIYLDNVKIEYITSTDEINKLIEYYTPDIILSLVENIPLFKNLIFIGKILHVTEGIYPWYCGKYAIETALSYEDIRNIGGTVLSLGSDGRVASIIDYVRPKLEVSNSLQGLRNKIWQDLVSRLIDLARQMAEGNYVTDFLLPYHVHLEDYKLSGKREKKTTTCTVPAELIKRYTTKLSPGPEYRGSIMRRIQVRLARRFPPGLYILLYHSLTNCNDLSMLEKKVSTSCQRFAEHISYYQDNFECVSLSEGLRIIENDELTIDHPHAVITFDDAYRSVLDYAIPLLNNANIKSCIFTCSDTAAKRKGLWRVRLDMLITNMGENALSALNQTMQCSFNSYHELFNYAKNEFSLSLVSAIDTLWDESGLSGEDIKRFLSFQELKSIEMMGHEIGSHTISHPLLAALSSEEVCREVIEGHREIEHELDHKICYFSYPFGQYWHWNNDAEMALLQIPNVYAFTANGGVNFKMHPFNIRRIGILNHTIMELRDILMQNAYFSI